MKSQACLQIHSLEITFNSFSPLSSHWYLISHCTILGMNCNHDTNFWCPYCIIRDVAQPKLLVGQKSVKLAGGWAVCWRGIGGNWGQLTYHSFVFLTYHSFVFCFFFFPFFFFFFSFSFLSFFFFFFFKANFWLDKCLSAWKVQHL